MAVSPGFEIEEYDADARIPPENDHFIRSEAQQQLLDHDGGVGETARNASIAGSCVSSAGPRRYAFNNGEAMPENGSSTAGMSLKDYAPKRLWNSVWLHKAVLGGFATLCSALFIAIILLDHFSAIHHGLSTQTAKNKYSWTYGPTAGESPVN